MKNLNLLLTTKTDLRVDQRLFSELNVTNEKNQLNCFWF